LTTIFFLLLLPLIAYPRLDDVGVLRKVFKAIADTKDTFREISDELTFMGIPISEGVLSKFYNDKTNLNVDNRVAVRKWVEKYLDEKKNKETPQNLKMTLVELGITINTY
jgi:hypothetical protein